MSTEEIRFHIPELLSVRELFDSSEQCIDLSIQGYLVT